MYESYYTKFIWLLYIKKILLLQTLLYIQINASQKMICSDYKKRRSSNVHWGFALSRRGWRLESEWEVYRFNVQIQYSPNIELSVHGIVCTSFMQKNWQFLILLDYFSCCQYSVLDRLVLPSSRVFLKKLWRVDIWELDLVEFRSCTFHMWQIVIGLTFSWVEIFITTRSANALRTLCLFIIESSKKWM